MPTSLDHLLPGADEHPRCADFTRAIAADPGGTALRADRIVLVEVPLPWPKPALDHPVVAPLARALKAATLPTRLLVSVPVAAGGPAGPDGSAGAGEPAGPDGSAGAGEPVAADGAAAGGPLITVFERRGSSAVERRYRPGSPEAALALAEALAAGDDGAAAPHLEAEHDPARPTLLVCTQGSHDVCCGADGTRLAAQAEALTGPGGALHRIHRVSHTGGHRFAPTAMTLPDGRMWAFLDLDLLGGILARTTDPAEAAAHCRGWWGAAEGPAQIAERAVLARRGWSLDAADRLVAVTELPTTDSAGSGGGETAGRGDGASDATAGNGGGETAGGGTTGGGGGDKVGKGKAGRGPVRVTVEVAGPEGPERWEAEVEPGREIPTIACRQPGGLPAKTGREYVVRSLTGPVAPG